jgi:zinc transport system ATP-binding protein
MDLCLKVENLSVELEGHPILQNLSFEVERGEKLMIVGPNGAGKTTLFRALMGFIPYQGSVVWKRGVQLGFVPQSVDVNRKFPLAVHELFPLGKKRVREQDVREALAMVSAEGLYQRTLSSLSGGEFQRVLIAFALAQKPDVLLFDEPTSDIDVGGQGTIYNRLEEIADEQGLTMLMISHDLSVVFRYATKVLCLNRGFQCQGEPRQVLTPERLEELYGTGVSFYRHMHGDHEDSHQGAHHHQEGD